MKSEDPFLSKSHIDYRFGLAVEVLLNEGIANSKGEIAEDMGVKPAKFSEILNGRMHVGVDMLAMLSDHYLVNPDWLLTGRGDCIFRSSSILPKRLNDGEPDETHPYKVEDDEEIVRKMESIYEREKKETEEKYSSQTLLSLLAEKDKTLLQQAEELGKLKERIAQLEREKNDYEHSTHPVSRKETVGSL